MKRLVFFEDLSTAQFTPIALLRPVFELLCGHFSQRERLIRLLAPQEWGALVRDELAEVYAEEHPNSRINDIEWVSSGDSVLVNGRWFPDPQNLKLPDSDSAFWVGDTLVAVGFSPNDSLPATAVELRQQLASLTEKKKRISVAGDLISYPWDLIARNPSQLVQDYSLREKEEELTELDPRVAIVGDRDNVFIHSSAVIDPFVVIDVTQGPVWIDAEVRVQAFTRIEGPSWIGPQSQLFRTNLREGCSIGPVCRVGGEVEESILHGYANKYHEGFLGHSYICPWVNLGALTTTSDLKNDYSNVSVPWQGERMNTGSPKIGSFIGDHTKTALCSLFNTGSSVGMMSLLLPGGELFPKFIPSFSRLWHGSLQALPDGCESAIHVARLAMARRQVTMTPAMEKLLRWQFEQTQSERDLAIR